MLNILKFHFPHGNVHVKKDNRAVMTVTRRIKQGGQSWGKKKEEVVQADPVILYIALSTVSCKVLQNSLKILKENTVEIKYFCGNYLVSGCCDTWFSCLA